MSLPPSGVTLTTATRWTQELDGQQAALSKQAHKDTYFQNKSIINN